MNLCSHVRDLTSLCIAYVRTCVIHTFVSFCVYVASVYVGSWWHLYLRSPINDSLWSQVICINGILYRLNVKYDNFPLYISMQCWLVRCPH